MNTTLKTLAFLSIASFVFMGGCLKKLVKVNFDYHTEAEIETDSHMIIGPLTFGESVVTSTLQKELEDNNASLDMLDELKLKSASVSILNDPLANFDNVEKVELWISADGQPEILLASKMPVPDALNSVDLDVNNGDNLANYLRSPTFTYRISGLNTGPLYPMTLKINAVWDVHASGKK